MQHTSLFRTTPRFCPARGNLPSFLDRPLFWTDGWRVSHKLSCCSLVAARSVRQRDWQHQGQQRSVTVVALFTLRRCARRWKIRATLDSLRQPDAGKRHAKPKARQLMAVWALRTRAVPPSVQTAMWSVPKSCSPTLVDAFRRVFHTSSCSAIFSRRPVLLSRWLCARAGAACARASNGLKNGFLLLLLIFAVQHPCFSLISASLARLGFARGSQL